MPMKYPTPTTTVYPPGLVDRARGAAAVICEDNAGRCVWFLTKGGPKAWLWFTTRSLATAFAKNPPRGTVYIEEECEDRQSAVHKATVYTLHRGSLIAEAEHIH